jgi:hypothetical protein
LLQQKEWSIKRVKCSFAKSRIAYLGYVISGQGVSIALNKVKAVLDWKREGSEELSRAC